MPKIYGAATQKHEEAVRRLAEFCGLDSVHYVDHGMKEEYVLVKEGAQLSIEAAYNRDQGGFLVIGEVE